MTDLITLTAAHRSEPLGVAARDGLMFGWTCEAAAPAGPIHAVVEVAQDADNLARGELLWSSEPTTSHAIPYGGPAIGSRGRRAWRVVLRDESGATSISAPATIEVGLEGAADWAAQWISGPLLPNRREQWDPVPLLRREFTVGDVGGPARAYVSALGIYRLWVNGVELTAEALLRPGWTDYDKRVLHQTYALDDVLIAGVNVVGVELARGWYAGRLGLQREPALYGEHPALILQIEVDGQPVVATGEDWVVAHGEVLASDLLLGETQDLRQARPGWSTPGFDASDWIPAAVRSDLSVRIDPQTHESPRTYEELEGRLVRAHARGPAVYDFGQNVIGWTRVSGRTLPKADVLVRHGEILTADDLVWRDNLRGAFQEDRYTTGDGEHHVLEPRHTQHGFRFAEVWNLAPVHDYLALEVPEDVRVTARAITQLDRVGTFTCSDEELTAVASLVEWTVRDNFLEVITDCPQRDERLGWLGDAGVIAESAAYAFDIAGFVAKFAQDASDAQADDGALRSYVPPVPPGTWNDGAPGWADGYVRLVHLAAQRYGDLVTAAQHVDRIGAYLAWIDAANPSGIRTERVGSDFSDWLSLPEDPDEPPHPGYAYTGARSTSSKRVIATAHTIRSYDQYADLLTMLGRDAEAARARTRAEEIRLAYARELVDESGRIEGDTQTAYAQALGYDILRGADRERAAAHLARKVAELGHVTVGIHGSEHILPALAHSGHADLAELLLLREDMPGWKHMVRMGGTTIWEKWDGIAADGRMSTAEMNSFNHCALGAVGQFLFEGVAGLNARDTVTTSAVTIRPTYFRGLTWARADYDSPAGLICSSWRRDGEDIIHAVTVPAGVRIDMIAPDGLSIVGTEIAGLVTTYRVGSLT